MYDSDYDRDMQTMDEYREWIRNGVVGECLYEDGTCKNWSEIALVGRTADGNVVHINTDDPGKIPHFHYRDKDDWEKFHTCIRLDSPEYFHHGNKQDVLSGEQKEELMVFLSSPHRGWKEIQWTNWEYLVYMWGNENPDYTQLDMDFPMPDYMKL